VRPNGGPAWPPELLDGGRPVTNPIELPVSSEIRTRTATATSARLARPTGGKCQRDTALVSSEIPPLSAVALPPTQAGSSAPSPVHHHLPWPQESALACGDKATRSAKKQAPVANRSRYISRWPLCNLPKKTDNKINSDQDERDLISRHSPIHCHGLACALCHPFPFRPLGAPAQHYYCSQTTFTFASRLPSATFLFSGISS
jgi:hypothetical protein